MNRSLVGSGAPVVARVYDIANCGPRNRFVANGKLVHNSGGDKLNLQNLPSRGGNNTIRRALKAPPGHVIVACDSSQIEARLVGWLAGQDDLTEAFRDKRDVYCEFASDVYGRTITKADTTERFVGKSAILSLGYGAGAVKFREMLRIQGGVVIDEIEADMIVRTYRQKYHKIVALWQRCGRMLNTILTGGTAELGPVTVNHKGIELPSGLYIQYPALRNTGTQYEYISDARSYNKFVNGTGEPVWTKIYGGKVTENITQALAALFIRQCSVQIGKRYHVAFQVHDEIVAVVPESEAEVAEQYIVDVMNTPPVWAPDLPVACESGVAVNYGDT